MLQVTWEWIAMYTSRLDLASTGAISGGVEYDLLEGDGAYERWAEAAARSPALHADAAAALCCGSAFPDASGLKPRALTSHDPA